MLVGRDGHPYSWGNEIFLKMRPTGKCRQNQIDWSISIQPMGLFDKYGNVCEWVDDWYGDYSPMTKQIRKEH